MKKITLIACLMLLFAGAFAQNGGLKITNSHSTCDLTFTMYALAPSLGGTGNCDELVSNTFVVPAGVTRNFPSVFAFQSTVGWASTPGLVSLLTTDFQWSSGFFATTCFPSCTPSTSWTKFADGYACQGANLLCSDGCATVEWISTFYGTGMDNVFIKVY